jgi:hypothetical protein
MATASQLTAPATHEIPICCNRALTGEALQDTRTGVFRQSNSAELCLTPDIHRTRLRVPDALAGTVLLGRRMHREPVPGA